MVREVESADPAEMADGVNRFAYSRSSPVVRIDPTGKRSEPSDEDGEITQLKSALEDKFQVQFDTAKVRDAYAAQILSFGRVEGRDRIEQLNKEIAAIEEREFNLTELRVLEQALTLVEPFRTKNMEGVDMPIAIAKLEKGLIMRNPPIVGIDILVEPRRGPLAGLAFSDGAIRATALFDLSEDAAIDKSFMAQSAKISFSASMCMNYCICPLKKRQAWRTSILTSLKARPRCLLMRRNRLPNTA